MVRCNEHRYGQWLDLVGFCYNAGLKSELQNPFPNLTFETVFAMTLISC